MLTIFPLGVTPVIREYKIEPTLKISLDVETGSDCDHTSGEIKPGVPQIVFPTGIAIPCPLGLEKFAKSMAKPKSQILMIIS